MKNILNHIYWESEIRILCPDQVIDSGDFTFTCNPNSLAHQLHFCLLSIMFLFFPVSTFDTTVSSYWLSLYIPITQVGNTYLTSSPTAYQPLPEFLTSDSFPNTHILICLFRSKPAQSNPNPSYSYQYYRYSLFFSHLIQCTLPGCLFHLWFKPEAMVSKASTCLTCGYFITVLYNRDYFSAVFVDLGTSSLALLFFYNL